MKGKREREKGEKKIRINCETCKLHWIASFFFTFLLFFFFLTNSSCTLHSSVVSYVFPSYFFYFFFFPFVQCVDCLELKTSTETIQYSETVKRILLCWKEKVIGMSETCINSSSISPSCSSRYFTLELF